MFRADEMMGFASLPMGYVSYVISEINGSRTCRAPDDIRRDYVTGLQATDFESLASSLWTHDEEEEKGEYSANWWNLRMAWALFGRFARLSFD